MGYIFVDRENDGGMRANMRHTMIHGSRPMMRGHEEEMMHEPSYRRGYREGWQDADEERYRRDSMGRFM